MAKEILITPFDKKSLHTIREIIEDRDTTCEKFIDLQTLNLIETLDRAIYNLENGAQYFKEIPNELGENWYYAECESCGWHGMSKYLLGGHAIADTGDYSDCICPVCWSKKII